MKLSKADESALIISLTDAIQRCGVTHYSYAAVGQEWLDQSLEGIDPETATKLTRTLQSLEVFFNREVMKRLLKAGHKVPSREEDDKKLTSYKGFSEPLRLARELANDIKALPRQYLLAMEAPAAFDAYISDGLEIGLSEQLSFLSGEKLAERVSVKADPQSYHDYIAIAANRSGFVPEVQKDVGYFVYRTSGYIGSRWNPPLLNDFFDAVRSFYGSAISNGIFYPMESPGKKRTPFVVVNELEDSKGELVYVSSVEEDLRRASNILLKAEQKTTMDNGTPLQDILKPVIKMFNCRERQRMTTAAIWLLRAHMSTGAVDQVLESAIAIEILLGDREASDRIGLSKLMANRCAYSLGKSFEERRHLIEFFIKYYKVRSDIVHSGRLRITDDESEVVGKGVALASRLLCHEVNISEEPT